MPMSALAGLALGIAVLSISLYHWAVITPRLRSLLQTLEGEMQADDDDSVARLRTQQAQFAKRTEERLAELERIARRQPDLFAHWRLLQGRGRTMGAG